MAKRLLLRVGIALLGMVVTLTWWTIHKGGSSVQSSSRIPEKVLAGGHKLEVEIETSCPATMRISFDDLSKTSGEQQILQSWEKIPAGMKSWTIDVPAGLGGYIELGADGPQVGDKLTMRIKVNGVLVDEQSESLKEPLQPNTAFFLQQQFEDYSRAKKDND
jgi:hypothetical protein